MASEINSKLIACKKCGVIMFRISRDICPLCFREEEELFRKVKHFLRENPGAAVYQVAKHVECTEEEVQEFILSGRLERAGVTKIAHPCLLCQTVIMEGFVCNNCKHNLKTQVDNLKTAIDADQPSRSPAAPAPDLFNDKKTDDIDGGHVGKKKR